MADTYLRRYSLYVNTQPSAINISYGYDNASRLLTVGDGNGNSATYTYLDNSPLVGQIEFKQGTSATPMKTAKQYDYLNRLISISNSPSSSAQISYSYQYNNANQRVRTTLADGNYWIYQYDKLGQVTSGKKYWLTGLSLLGSSSSMALMTSATAPPPRPVETIRD